MSKATMLKKREEELNYLIQNGTNFGTEVINEEEFTIILHKNTVFFVRTEEQPAYQHIALRTKVYANMQELKIEDSLIERNYDKEPIYQFILKSFSDNEAKVLLDCGLLLLEEKHGDNLMTILMKLWVNLKQGYLSERLVIIELLEASGVFQQVSQIMLHDARKFVQEELLKNKQEGND